MGEIKKVPVKIQGVEYRINCTEDEQYIQKLAYYVDKKVKQTMASNQALDVLRAMTLVSLNLADNLFKAVKAMEKSNGKNNIKLDETVYNEIEKINREGIPETGTEKP